jgi:hypothetical protein
VSPRCEALDGNEERLVLLQEAERMQRMDDKLKSLQLNGLVEFSDKAAKYALRLCSRARRCLMHAAYWLCLQQMGCSLTLTTVLVGKCISGYSVLLLGAGLWF